MEILNSGSFIPLDNREKIEQLIFTARTLAVEVSRNDGFQSSGQSNQQIGLELWNGAEYMTRSHEEVTIRNIFLSKFLERLREIERESAQPPSAATAPVMPSQEKVSASETALSPVSHIDVESDKTAIQQDEFLGVVADSEDPAGERPSYANECVPECEDEIAAILSSAGTSRVIDVISDQSGERISPTRMEERPKGGDSVSHTAPGMIADNFTTDIDPVLEVAEIKTSEESSSVSEEAVSLIEEQSVKSVVLAEQEPYNFDSCTVTAVIQLLPEADGVRDCVLSVRSHNFAPQIAFSNINGESGRSDLGAQLSDALEQYRTALPGLAAEKLKREKPSTKKRTSKPGDKSTKVGETTKTTNTETTATPSPAVQEQVKDQQTLFAS